MQILNKFLILLLVVTCGLITSCEPLDTSLQEEEIVQGLKEALKVGLGNSTARASSLDGYLKNEVIKILLPEEVASLQNQINANAILSTVYTSYINIENNGNDLFDGLITSMNRGAEDAAKTSGPIFGNAITRMSFQDARAILNSSNDRAITRFYEMETRTELIAAFTPNVNQALDDNNANHLYSMVLQVLDLEVNPILGTTVGQLLNTDPNLPSTLGEYATGKAVDGLFYLVGEEEKKIRDDPFAWGSEIIERVFGG